MPKFSEEELAELQARTLELEARKGARTEKSKKPSGSRREANKNSSLKEKLVAPFLLLFTILISLIFYLMH